MNRHYTAKKMIEAQHYARRIKKEKNINVFEETRRAKVVLHRSILNKILYSIYGYRDSEIASFYRSNGKKMDRTTILHSVNTFDSTYTHYDKNIYEYFNYLIKTSDMIDLVDDVIELMGTLDKKQSKDVILLIKRIKEGMPIDEIFECLDNEN